MTARFYTGTVYHKRFGPKVHELAYQVFTLYVDLDRLDELHREHRFFSKNRFNLLSLYEKDYGNPNSAETAPLKVRLVDLMRSEGIDANHESVITMLTYPRVLGYSFNPLTVYYCQTKDQTPLAVIYEVRNTFGERHNYIYAVPKGGRFTDPHSSDKCFHVSPFFDREGSYDFALTPPKDKAAVVITYKHDGEKRLTASFSGKEMPFTDRSIAKLVGAYPFMTLKVFAGILWEAGKLWFKGLKVFTHPEKHAYQSSKAVGHTNKKQMGETLTITPDSKRKNVA